MAPDSVRIFTNFTSAIFESSAKLFSQQVKAVYHRHTYHASPDARNVVVIGGSFAGLQLAKRLSQSLPSGYRVVLVEKNSHFNFNFNFPRYSVVGDERKAFIPIGGAFGKSPDGSWEIVRDTVTSVTDREVLLESGQKLPYAYLAIATGFRQTLPARMVSTDRDESCDHIRDLRAKIERAEKIALSTDIRSVYPNKEILLIHSRDRLLTNFGKRLSDFVESKLESMSIKVMLGERPKLATGNDGKSTVGSDEKQETGMLVFKDNRKLSFDLIIPCTGAIPNTDFLSLFVPHLLSKTTGRILVRPTLQVEDDTHPNVFALGDISESEGPKMGRTAMAQADLVGENIVAMIQGKGLKEYVPQPIDGMLKLSLGINENVAYVPEGKGGDIMVPGKTKNIDLEVSQAWWYLGGDMKAELGG
ncbi:oxidoreductase [Plectosphaerella cucumerina]|uniref:Oxidoreductase n=1 Tax=Plectosphaerella cucumerina TaxID=40658 RepID=A0A8K0T7D9_9PEZI|nr:oxidoreductase [Plectosphaerella cucumerina]